MGFIVGSDDRRSVSSMCMPFLSGLVLIAIPYAVRSAHSSYISLCSYRPFCFIFRDFIYEREPVIFYFYFLKRFIIIFVSICISGYKCMSVSGEMRRRPQILWS